MQSEPCSQSSFKSRREMPAAFVKMMTMSPALSRAHYSGFGLDGRAVLHVRNPIRVHKAAFAFLPPLQLASLLPHPSRSRPGSPFPHAARHFSSPPAATTQTSCPPGPRHRRTLAAPTPPQNLSIPSEYLLCVPTRRSSAT